MKSTVRWRACAVALCLGLGVHAGRAQASAPEDCGPYRVGVGEYPRLYERLRGASGPSDAEGGAAYQGMSKDFYAALAQRSGCVFTFEVESQPRLWRRIKDGTLDAAGWVIPTPERKPYVSVIPLLSLHLMAMTWGSQHVQSQAEFMERPSLRAVAVRDSAYGPDYDALIQQLRAQGRLSEVADVDTALKVFAAHRVDLLIAYPWALANLLDQQAAASGPTQDEVKIADWHPSAPDVVSGLALSRRTVSDEDMRRILGALKLMQRDGSLGRIVDKYLPEGSAKLVPSLVPQ